jgi:predicted lipoprotein with Yx(FWY)xxD motif
MKINLARPLAIVAGTLFVISAFASGALAAPAHQATPQVQLASNSKFGSILVNAQGMTLYTLSSETGGNILCTAKCAGFWPPLLVPAGTTSPTGAPGVAGTLGVVTRAEGTQVTLNGFPLYNFSGDKAAGDTNGEGLQAFGGTWHVARNLAEPLAATPVERLVVHITTSGSTVWGVVTIHYSSHHKTAHLTCALATCRLAIPLGAMVHLTQSPTSATTWPFQRWQIKRVSPASKTIRVSTSATSFRMNARYNIKAIYVLM